MDSNNKKKGVNNLTIKTGRVMMKNISWIKQCAIILFIYSTVILFSINLALGIVTPPDSQYLNEKWNYNARERINGIYVGDFNGDGKKEIAAMGSIEGTIYVINYDGNKLWKKNVFCPVYAITGVKWYASYKGEDIILSSCTHVHAFSSEGEVKWQFFTNHGEARVLFPVDINDDGEKELLIGSGDPTSSQFGKNNLYLINKNGQVIWKAVLPSAPYAIDVKDIDFDGKKDIVVGTNAQGFGFGVYRGRVMLYDNKGTKKWETRTKNGIYSIKIEDLDRNGDFEIIAGSFPETYIFNNKGEKKYEYTTGAHAYSLGILEENKIKKLIVGTNDIYLLNAKLEKEWKFDSSDEAYFVSSEDIDGDGTPEILAGSDKVYVLNTKGELVWSSKDLSTVKGMSVADLDGDGYNEVIEGGLDKKIHVFENEFYVKKTKAENNMLIAKGAFENGSYDKALSYAKKAKDIFNEIKENRKENEAANLIGNIESMKADDSKILEGAEDYLNQSRSFYLNDKFKSAYIFAKKTIEKYGELNKKTPIVEKAIEDAKTIQDNSFDVLKSQSLDFYELSLKQLKEGKYRKALDSVHEAESTYKWLNVSDMEEKSGGIFAKSLCLLAGREFENNDLKNASIHINASLRKYKTLTNSTTYQKSAKECNELKDKIDASSSGTMDKGLSKSLSLLFSRNNLVIIGLIVLLIILIVISAKVIHPRIKRMQEERIAHNYHHFKEIEKEKIGSLGELGAKSSIKKSQEKSQEDALNPSAAKEIKGSIKDNEKVIPEQPQNKVEEVESGVKKQKIPKLEPIKKDKFKGVGRSIRL